MKTINIKALIAIVALFFYQNSINAQTINWGNISKQNKQLLHVNLGAEHGIVASFGYHHLFPVKNFPFFIGGEFSTPFGNHLADDIKIKLGGQISVIKVDNFQFSARIQGVARRHESSMVRLFNFGSDFAGTLGYYRKNWFLGAEVGFDKAIVTNFKHSQWYKENIYDSVQDGWFEPATGGNFYYGAIAGVSIKKIDISIKAGKLLQEDFVSKPTLPFYGQIGVNIKF